MTKLLLTIRVVNIDNRRLKLKNLEVSTHISVIISLRKTPSAKSVIDSIEIFVLKALLA